MRTHFEKDYSEITFTWFKQCHQIFGRTHNSSRGTLRSRWIQLTLCYSIILLGSIINLTLAQTLSPTTQGDTRGTDTHTHLDGIYFSGGSHLSEFDKAAATALAVMDEIGLQKALLLPPPFSPDKIGTPVAYNYTVLKAVADNNPDRFGFIGGGGLLSPRILEADAGAVTDSMKQEFKQIAEEIAAAGAAGFGEFAAEHFSFFEGHNYISTQPNHPLFKVLADVSAESKTPIDLHMEAIEFDIPMPDGFDRPPNPDTLRENIDDFEKLLSYNRQAKIVWTHVGWDNTGHMTVVLLRRLLDAHSNLYMAIKILDSAGFQVAENRPIYNDGTIRPEWLQLIRDFSDRFVLGGDEFFGIPGKTPERPPSTKATWRFIAQLPESLASKVSHENAAYIYKGTTTSVNDGKEIVPSSFVLEQNYPNPFNPGTTIGFTIPSEQKVTLKLFDLLGREVATLIDSKLAGGAHEFYFDAKNFTSGVYIYQLTIDEQTVARKLLLIR